VRYVRIDEDARDYERLSTDFPFTVVHNGVAIKGRVSEISMSGCTLQTETPMQLGQVIDLKLHISNDPIMIDSLIIRNTSANRAGVEFLRLHQRERMRLQFFVGQERGRFELRGGEVNERSTLTASGEEVQAGHQSKDGRADRPHDFTQRADKGGQGNQVSRRRNRREEVNPPS